MLGANEIRGIIGGENPQMNSFCQGFWKDCVLSSSLKQTLLRRRSEIWQNRMVNLQPLSYLLLLISSSDTYSI